MTNEEIMKKIDETADSISKRVNKLADSVKELSDRTDRMSRALFYFAQYDPEYDNVIHNEIDKVEKEAAELIRKNEKEVKYG